MKYYVIHYPKRPERKENIIRQFAERGISLDDVTWIEGFNKDDHFVKWVKAKTKSPMPLGQMACSVKHYLAVQDIVEKNVQEAIIFEDDVVVHPEFDKLDPTTFPRDIGLMRLGAGVHIIESWFKEKATPDAAQTHMIGNPGGSEATWMTYEFACNYVKHANFDYSIDMTHHGMLAMKNHPLLLRYVCHQTSLGTESDSTTGQCPGNWHDYVMNFSKHTKYSFQDLVDEYRNTMVVMYPRKGHGFANTLIYLTDFYSKHMITGAVVHDSIADYEVGRWVTFKFPTTTMTGIKQEYEPKIFINQDTTQNTHPFIRHIIEPSEEMEVVIQDHKHLLEGVTAGMHVRRGASALDSRVIVEVDTDTFANDSAVSRFLAMADNFGPVFLASDSPDTKKKFASARMLDTTIAVVHGMCPGAPTKDRRNVFLDFFLLSMCPKVFVTGGNFPGLPGLSTFGYMAAQYGGVPWEIISN